MRTNALLFLVGLACGTGCRSVLHSDLTVQPGKQFVLGGNQRGAFTVRAANNGKVPVTLSKRRTNGQTTSLGTFSPGNRQTLRFAAGSAVLVTNPSAQPARIDLTVMGDKDNLTMQEQAPGKP